MSCYDCWEWFVGFVLRCERESLGDDFPGKSEPPEVETNHLSTTHDDEFIRERMKQLFNKHGFNLAVFPGGHIRGVRDAFNVYSVLEIIPVGRGQVRIRGVETGTYLAMNSNGTIYGSESANDEETVFLETTSANYFLYKSKAYAHLDWYLGIKRNGQTKNGEKTWYPWGQKAVLFVHRKPFMEIHPLKQLRNRHGFTLTISVDGKVKGTREDFSKESVLEFTPSNPPGAFRIRGVASRMYLAMDSKGRLYAEKDRLNDNTLFTEHSMGRYFVYLSVRWAHLGWHVGIKKSGKPKKGRKTVYPAEQKAIQFEHRYPYPSGKDFEPMSNTSPGPLGDDNFPPLAYIDDDIGDQD